MSCLEQVGGPHRGGTTLLADLLAAHPLVDGLAEPTGQVGSRERGSGGRKGPQNEGIFLQTVLPKFRFSMGPAEIIARTLTGSLRQNGTGWATYAYAPEAHLTEANETGLLTGPNRQRLMTDWARCADPQSARLAAAPTALANNAWKMDPNRDRSSLGTHFSRGYPTPPEHMHKCKCIADRNARELAEQLGYNDFSQEVGVCVQGLLPFGYYCSAVFTC